MSIHSRSNFFSGVVDRARPLKHAEDEVLGFFGPKDPKTLPLHMKLCLGGLLLPPLWWIGAVLGCKETDCWSELWQFRCRALSIISLLIAAGLAVIHGISTLE